MSAVEKATGKEIEQEECGRACATSAVPMLLHKKIRFDCRIVIKRLWAVDDDDDERFFDDMAQMFINYQYPLVHPKGNDGGVGTSL